MSLDWKQRSQQVLFQGGFRPHDPSSKVVFTSGSGSLLVDSSGAEWLDLVCGYSSLNFGHCHPGLVRLAREQLGELAHVGAAATQASIELAEALIAALGSPVSSSVLFCSSGARAIEAAWKAVTEFRPGKLVVLSPALHGRSIATAALSDTPKSGLSRLMQSAVEVWPNNQYPDCRSCPWNLHYPSCGLACTRDLERYIDSEASGISALLVEPAMTARGYIFPPADYFLRLREMTRQHGILMVADEVQTGLGRCAPFLLSVDQGWQADLSVVGKSLGGGLFPISALVGDKRVLEALASGVESETFSAMPVAAVVAKEVLRMLRDDRAHELGCEVAACLAHLLDELFGNISLVSCEKASCAIEFMTPSCDQQAAQDLAREFTNLCGLHRLRVQLSGPRRTRVVFLPALTMTREELCIASERLAGVEADFTKHRLRGFPAD